MRCKTCGGDAYLMGGLGNLNWYRCQNCGMEFSKMARKKKPKTSAVKKDVGGK